MAKRLSAQKASSRPQSAVGRAMTAGFTIIELMMVLAIAGLILMMVLRTVPALIRNGHNNSRKADVAAILEAVSHWELTHSGNFPVTADPFLQYTNLTYYDKPSVTATLQGAGSGAVAGNTSLSTVKLYNRAVCDPEAPGDATGASAGYNDVVALYAIETGNSFASKCQQL